MEKKMTNTYRFLVGKPKERDQLEALCLDGRIILE